MKWNVVAVTVATVVTVGCRHAPSQLPEKAVCEPVPNAAVVCIYRNQGVYAGRPINVGIDRSRVGLVENDSLVQIVLEPGAHTASAWDVKQLPGGSHEFNVVAGEVQFLQLQVFAGPVTTVFPVLQAVPRAQALEHIDADCAKRSDVDLRSARVVEVAPVP